MPTFIMLARLNPEAAPSPRGLEQLERDAMKRVHEECPDVEWLNSYAVLGPCDYLDIFIANDIENAARVSALIRTFGQSGRRLNGIDLRILFDRYQDRPDSTPVAWHDIHAAWRSLFDRNVGHCELANGPGISSQMVRRPRRRERRSAARERQRQ